MKVPILRLLCLLALCNLGRLHADVSVVLSPERANHTATLLDSGKVLIAGGINESGELKSALLYDPATNTLTATGDLVVGRTNHTATKLFDGQVLIAGGEVSSGQNLKSAEIYNPTTGLFTHLAKPMGIPRTKHTATLLNDGTVLIVGGKSAELFDPATQTFTTLASIPLYRSSHSAVLLNDGTVLITGGYVGPLSSATAEIYDPEAQTFTATPTSMGIPRANHRATRLPDGQVLVTGGFTGTSPQDECDIYDPATRVFTRTAKMNFHRSSHGAVLLSSGKVMIVGGTTLESGFLATNEVFDPADPGWTTTPSMNENRSGASVTLLQNGQVFVAGGVGGSLTLQTAEILDPITRSFTRLPKLNVGRNQHTATLLPDGRVFLAGGSNNSSFLNSAEIFNPATNSFGLTGTMAQARKSHTATLLQDENRILVAGGKTPSSDSLIAEIYEITTGKFRRIADLNVERSLYTATLLANGSVLMTAGRHGSTPTNTAELFDPVTETFSLTGSLNVQRKRHQATLLLDGTVFVSGGASSSNGNQPDSGTPTCEIYDPDTGLFTLTPEEMSVGRTEHDATRLPDGKVIVTGGILIDNQADLYSPGSKSFSLSGSLVQERLRHVAILLTHPAWGSLMNKVLVIGGADIGNGAYGGLEEALPTVELYDPTTGQFSFFGNMTDARQNHSATLLMDGRIFIAGGVDRPSFSGTAEIVNPEATLMPCTLANVSTRMNVGTGDKVLIGGFIISGDSPKKVIMRGIGASLPLAGNLADPVLELYDSAGRLITANDNWQDTDREAIIDTGLAPTNDLDSAILRTLAPDAYTAVVHGTNGDTGVALVEVYDLDAAGSSVVANISTRGFVQAADNAMINGLIVIGEPTLNILVRAVGPSLPIPGTLADPTLELYDSGGNLIAYNDNWRSDNEAAILQTDLAPTHDAEAAIVATVGPGLYTAVVRGVDNTSGIGLVETYRIHQ